MHVKGMFPGNKEASEIALRVFAGKYGDEPGKLSDMIMELSITRIAEEIVKKG